MRIDHSTDLVNRTLLASPLNREDLLDMRGNPDSCTGLDPAQDYFDGIALQEWHPEHGLTGQGWSADFTGFSHSPEYHA